MSGEGQAALTALLSLLSIAAFLGCVLQFLRIAWFDFQTLKIRNLDLMLLLVPAFTLAATRGGAGLLPDIGAGCLLLVLGILIWLLRMMGAGDAKLYFPLGLAVGWNGLAIYALGLIVASFGLMLAVRLRNVISTGAFRDRLAFFHKSKAYPYGVPMSFGAIAAMIFAGL